MTFPNPGTPEITFSSVDASRVFNCPGGVAAGDLLLLLHVGTSSGTLDAQVPAGWTRLTGTPSGQDVFWRTALGGETSVTVTFTGGGSGNGFGIIHCFKDAVQISPYVANSTLNPSSITASWGSDDNLFIASAFALDVSSADITNYPSTYTLARARLAAGTISVATAARQLAAASDDPGTFALSSGSAESSSAYTFVVKPGTGGGPTGPTGPGPGVTRAYGSFIMG